MTEPARSALRLVGDVGGTNMRFALAEASADGVRLHAPRSRPRGEVDGLETGLRDYLAECGADMPGTAVVAIAGPVQDGKAVGTNSAWLVSEAGLRDMGFAHARVVNDFAALAVGAEQLGPEDLLDLGGPPQGMAGATIAVAGAGTGFGVSALACSAEGRAVIATEGGHIHFAPLDAVEIDVMRLLSEKYGRCSVERILSGQGLVDLRWALGRLAGAAPSPKSPAEIVADAQSGAEALSLDTVRRFCAIYGATVGDIALALGARGGVFVGGGIAPRIAEILKASDFRERFEDKGRFRDYLKAIPTRVIMHPYAALIGAARMDPEPTTGSCA